MKIIVVTTWDNIELITAEASPNATRSRHEFPPTHLDDVMRCAMRRVKPCTLKECPSTNAPSRNKQIQFAQVLKAASTERTPHRASIASDAREVAGIGIGSQTHQVTVHRKSPSVRMPIGVTFCKGGTSSAIANNTGPSQRPSNRLRFSN